MFFTSSTLRPSIQHFKRSVAASAALVVIALCACAPTARAADPWSAKLDAAVRFYQTTDVGVLVVGTEKSLYGLDPETGEIIWRRKGARLDETDVAAVPGTDLLLISVERGDKTRLEAADLLTGDAVWRSDKVRGAVMQTAFDPDSNLLAAVFARDARGPAREGLKKKPQVHLFDIATGDELWKRELESEVEMMPASASGDDDKEVAFTLDNYRPPTFLDGRLYLFYEGITSLDARTGRERRREKFRVNEDGLALTEADPVADERFVYLSGRGHVRAVSRTDGETAWESKDLGLTPEMILARGVLYVRTGGQFTRLSDGEVAARGPFGVSAIDAATGKILWRYKGADKGITNIAMPDATTIAVADRDDLVLLDAASGKRRTKVSHGVEAASFIVLNERGEIVLGGKNEVAAFDSTSLVNLWRERHDPPGRGLLRTAAAVATRAASLYFRYGGAASTVFRGAQVVNAVNSFRWSGLAAHVTVADLSSLVTDYSRNYATERIKTFGLLSRARSGAAATNPATNVLTRPRRTEDVDERLLDRLDPSSQLDRLSRFLMRTRRLASLRGHWMYFYTDVRGGHGLVGVNIEQGRAEREMRLNDPDERFISDETDGLLYFSKGDRLVAYRLDERY
ncbi:MAG TPA: PQQ-binding-like beta-propeller repeat protein [Pyrinomonadaceae bacterium]|nr:PQQ-binding-like beta-propeller repeat protein [Pyrinomonadaceae bacterium]